MIIVRPFNHGTKSVTTIPNDPKKEEKTLIYIELQAPPEQTTAVPPNKVIIEFAKVDTRLVYDPYLSETGNIIPSSPIK